MTFKALPIWSLEGMSVSSFPLASFAGVCDLETLQERYRERGRFENMLGSEWGTSESEDLQGNDEVGSRAKATRLTRLALPPLSLTNNEYGQK